MCGYQNYHVADQNYTAIIDSVSIPNFRRYRIHWFHRVLWLSGSRWTDRCDGTIRPPWSNRRDGVHRPERSIRYNQQGWLKTSSNTNTCAQVVIQIDSNLRCHTKNLKHSTIISCFLEQSLHASLVTSCTSQIEWVQIDTGTGI